jgi:iron complex outermembrane recepter protein
MTLEATPRLFFDAATFYNRYDDLITLIPGEPSAGESGLARVPVFGANGLDGETFGGEIAVTFVPVARSRMRASYSYLQALLEPKPGVVDLAGVEGLEDSTPSHQLDVRVFNEITRDVELDLLFRYVDAFGAGEEAGIERIPSYVNLDVRLAWRGPHGFELSAVGQNLLEKRHREFSNGGRIERGAYAKVVWRY